MVRAGTFLLIKQEGYEEILKKLCVGVLRRNAALATPATMDISQNGSRWEIVLKTTRTSNSIDFELGVPFEHITGLVINIRLGKSKYCYRKHETLSFKKIRLKIPINSFF